MLYIDKESVGKIDISKFPDLFASKSERTSKKYIKGLNDYFTAEARRQFNENVRTFARNYNFLKGKLTPEDFYEASQYEEMNDMFTTLDYDYERDGLPKDVQHYSILNQPINTLLGELSNKPDNAFVKAFDAESQAEQLQYMTDVVEKFMYSQVKNRWILKLTEEGADVNEEEFMQNVEQLTAKEVEEKLSSYSSLQERWANRMLEALKVQFNIKEKSESTFSDLLKSGRERYHIYEDKSPTGFNVEDVNPVNCFRLNNPDKKYTRDDHASGIIEVLNISEVMEKFKLSKKDVDNLRDFKKAGSNAPKSGYESITYGPTYDKTLELFEEMEDYGDFGSNYRNYYRTLHSEVGWKDESYRCTTTYVKAKIKKGKLTYVNSEGVETVDFVDEDYKDGTHPGQIDLEWAYDEQWYKAVNIANILYSYEPVEFIDRNPIIGGDFDPRNSVVKGLIDLAKPFQIIYTVAVNQLYRLLQKEIGVVYNMSLRKLSVPDDGDYRDALDMWEELARNQGVSIEDDSPENMNTPGGQTAAAKAIDLSRTGEIQSRYTLAQQMKLECWELLGITKERLGGVAASQTAQGAQISLSQSYAQTAPWFSHHYYIINDLYQAVLDAAQYYESQKESSTLSYVSGTAENVYIRIFGKDLKGRDLRVFVTDRAEDYEQLQRMRSFTNEMLQNGVDAYDVAVLMDNKSIRAHKDVLLRVKEQKQEMQRQAQEIEARKAQAIEQQTSAMQEIERGRIENENINNELDRKNRLEVATVQALGRQQGDNVVDTNNNNVPDMMDILRDSRETEKLNRDSLFKLQSQQSQERMDSMKIASKNRELVLREKEHKDKMKQLEEDRKLREKQITADKYIAAKNKN